jgi:hypothetical protein
MLKDMGWRLYRVWSTEWFHSRDAAIKLMLENVQRALDTDTSKSMPAAVVIEAEEEQPKTVSLPKLKHKHKSGEPYAKFKKRFKKDILLKPLNCYWLEEVLEELIAFEGPIHQDILEDRIREIFKVQKIGANISRNIEQAIRLGVQNKALKQKKSFIWSTNQELETFRVPSEDLSRTLRLIAPQEIALGILFLAEDQFGLIRDQAPQAVAKLFQDSRMDPDEADFVRDVIDDLVEKKALVVNGNQLNLA